MFRLNNAFRFVLFVAAFAVVTNVSRATFVPFTEDFDSNASNWFNRENNATVPWMESGGPDGGAYVTTTLNFLEFFSAGQAPALFRAHDELNSSGGAFVGDWIADGVNQSGFWVRHDATVPLQFFIRHAVTTNHPAGSSVTPFLVQPNIWTELTFPVPDPEMQFEGKFGFETVFHAVAHIQTGIIIPAALVGVDQTFRFDMDKVSILPEPTTLMLVAAFGVIIVRRRK